MRTFSVGDRRRLMVRRHHLRGDADGPAEVTAALVALHATDPATVYLSVLARSAGSTLADVSAAMYEERSLVRWMAMRRTLFVFPTTDIPLIQAAVGTALAAMLRRQLLSRMARNGTVPALVGDLDDWLGAVESAVEKSLQELGPATGSQLSTRVPDLGTTIRSGSPSERPQNLTSPLLTQMGAAGRIVRGSPTGTWTSRHHRWESVDRWWPEALPVPAVDAAQQVLAQRWLERFGPATVEDLQWWTGWNKTTTRRALAGLPIEEVDLHGTPGITLRGLDLPVGAEADAADREPTAALLPSLDPTAMGWTHREWFLGIDPGQIFDTAGNIGPTVWWDGEVIGSWAVTADEVRTAVPADRGAEARTAINAAAAQLRERLGGALVTPAIRTPLERSLA